MVVGNNHFFNLTRMTAENCVISYHPMDIKDLKYDDISSQLFYQGDDNGLEYPYIVRLLIT